MRSRWFLLVLAGMLAGLTACGGSDTAEETDTAGAAEPASKYADDLGTSTGEPAARVNDTVISVVDVAKVAKNFARQGLAPDPDAQGETEKEKLYYTIVDRLVEQRLVLLEARKQGLTVSDAQVAAGVDQVKGATGGDVAFQEALAEFGITLEDVERDVHDNLLTRAFFERIGNSLVSDEDVRKFFDDNKDRYGPQDEVNASHILIRTQPQMDDMAKAEIRQRAITARDRARAGEDFAELARELSEDEITGPQGGTLGWFGKGRMVPSFDSAVFSMKVGEISDLVETQFGYHVIQVVDERTSPGQSFDEVKESIRGLLSQQGAQTQFKATVDRLVSEAQVEVLPPSESTLAEIEAPAPVGGGE